MGKTIKRSKAVELHRSLRYTLIMRTRQQRSQLRLLLHLGLLTQVDAKPFQLAGVVLLREL